MQGAEVSIFYRNVPKVVSGKVLSVNTHMPTYVPGQPMSVLNGPVTDITVQVEQDTIPFAGLPANGVTANFQDKGIFLAIDRSAILREVESVLNNSKQALSQVPYHEKMVSACEDLILQLDSDKKKEAQQNKEMAELRGQLKEMKSMLSAFLESKKKEE